LANRLLPGWAIFLAILISWQLLGPDSALAAEVLQVRSADLLLIGDHNRTYSVRLACAKPIAAKQAEAVTLLRGQLPRHQRVNLMPMGSQDGLLLARVRPLGANQDLSTQLVAAGLADFSSSCIKPTKS
jgi:hypothetical protein